MTDTDPRDPDAGIGALAPAPVPAAAAASDVAASAPEASAPGASPAPEAPAPTGSAAREAGQAAPAAPGPGPELEPVEPGEVHPAAVETEPVGAPRGGRLARAGGYVVAAVAGGAIVAVVLAAAGMLGGSGSSGAPAASGAPAGSEAPMSSGAPVSSGDAALGSPSPAPSGAQAGAAPVLGDPAAPVLVEIWADYQCPYCGVMTHAIEPSLLRDLVDTGEIRLVFRDFAFLGDESVEAAAAARCAGRQGAYWRYHDLLFASQRGENQGAFGPETLAQLAAFADLDTQAFAACMDGREEHGATLAETEAGRAIDISSTPTFHIVGPKGSTFIKGVTKLSEIETAVQQTIDGTVPSPSPEPAASGPATPLASGSPDAGASEPPATTAP